MVKFCMFICFKPVPQVGNFEVCLFQDVIVPDTNNIGQYRLVLQIDSLDRNHLCTSKETGHQNRE